MSVDHKRWNERDFGECCFPVGGQGVNTIVCASPCDGAYCVTHRALMAAELSAAPPRKYKPKPRRAPTPKEPCCGRAMLAVTPAVLDAALEAAVSADPEVSAREARGRSLQRAAVRVRQHAMWSLREIRLADGGRAHSLPAIGAAFGVDHTTVLHGIRAHERSLAV